MYIIVKKFNRIAIKSNNKKPLHIEFRQFLTNHHFCGAEKELKHFWRQTGGKILRHNNTFSYVIKPTSTAV